VHGLGEADLFGREVVDHGDFVVFLHQAELPGRPFAREGPHKGEPGLGMFRSTFMKSWIENSHVATPFAYTS
jgi:hypothetical protein